MITCDHHNMAPEQIIDGLSDSQAGPGRHKCAVCAYARGIQNASAGEPAAPDGDLRTLPDSQAGPWRHKSAAEAYQRGYDAGRAGV
jgi:hypothetical protein